MHRLVSFVIAAVLGSTSVTSQAAQPGLGVPLDPRGAQVLSKTVFPDGRGLPPGQGTVAQGRTLYAQHCAMCHGVRGIEGPAARLAGSDGFIAWSDPLRPLRALKHPILVLSVGAQWPYATSIFDYVRRAMPYHAPKSLNDDEVYAVTGYLLHLNGLVGADAVMDRHTLPTVRMPGLARSVWAWPEVALHRSQIKSHAPSADNSETLRKR
ncbi:MAG: c-type cytochrome [Pseudomonadota bacterium]